MAASVGPYGAVLADGSEYSGDYGVTDRELRDFHGPRLELLAAAGADLLAVETVPSEQEATVLLGLLDGAVDRHPGLAVADVRRRLDHPPRRGRRSGLRAGRADVDTVVGVGVNCTAPEHVEALVAAAVAAARQAGGRLPEQRRDLGRRRPGAWGGDGAGVDPAAARSWVAAGARFVGGCCRVGSDDIARLAAGLSAQPV